ncbi:TOBE domain-containing protein [Desulfurispirillum indicum S5]|uniref:TOBE domain-containing protein n=1 Tax=Desulfurispirillum indicum (strain ATCC BAA-1389 / DSM 22839 / S5) TaxID=653733 RepID=E6W1N1_DESIS|nr:TOBE domain-containing protein [Desulfurispirillum indicum]ADU66580.1 TOBE domain-containing protein [Desulfurispirillum indicum S5]
MNTLTGIINAIDSDGSLSLVDIAVAGTHTMSALVVETPEQCPWLRQGNNVRVLFKETEVSIAKELRGQISLRNRLSATVTAVRSEGMLAEISLDFAGQQIVSIITSRSARRMELKVGDGVEWLVKANEISLSG